MPTLYCEAGKHEWERPAQRGRKPLNCPEHAAPKPTTDGPKLSPEERLEKARAAKIKKAEERRVAEEKAKKAEAKAKAKQFAEELPKKVEEYNKLLDKTKKLNSKEEISHAFNKLDNLQRAIISMRQQTRSAA